MDGWRVDGRRGEKKEDGERRVKGEVKIKYSVSRKQFAANQVLVSRLPHRDIGTMINY